MTLAHIQHTGLVVAIGLAVLFHYQASSYKARNASLLNEMELAEQKYQSDISRLNSALQTQNEAIEAYLVDLDSIQRTVTERNAELARVREERVSELLKELEKDSSSDNQLSIIDRMLHEFSQ